MIFTRRVILLAGLVVASAAHAAPTVQFSEVSGNGFGFWFSEPMLTWTGGDIVPATIEPPFACNWEWPRDRELTCRPRDGAKMQSATRYTVRFFGGLPARSGATLPPTMLAGDFDRPILVRSSEGWHDGRPTIDLGANLPIDTASLHEALLVQTDSGEVLTFDVTTPPLDVYVPIHAYRLRLSPIVGKRTVTVWLDAGLRTTAGELPGLAKDEPLVVAHFDEPFRLRQARCTRRGLVNTWTTGTEPSLACKPGTLIKLRFSRRIDDATLKALVASLPPAVRLHRARTSADEDTVVIVIDTPNASTAISLPSTIRASSGEALEPVSLLVETGDVETPPEPRIAQPPEQAGSR